MNIRLLERAQAELDEAIAWQSRVPSSPDMKNRWAK